MWTQPVLLHIFTLMHETAPKPICLITSPDSVQLNTHSSPHKPWCIHCLSGLYWCSVDSWETHRDTHDRPTQPSSSTWSINFVCVSMVMGWSLFREPLCISHTHTHTGSNGKHLLRKTNSSKKKSKWKTLPVMMKAGSWTSVVSTGMFPWQLPSQTVKCPKVWIRCVVVVVVPDWIWMFHHCCGFSCELWLSLLTAWTLCCSSKVKITRHQENPKTLSETINSRLQELWNMCVCRLSAARHLGLCARPERQPEGESHWERHAGRHGQGGHSAGTYTHLCYQRYWYEPVTLIEMYCSINKPEYQYMYQ